MRKRIIVKLWAHRQHGGYVIKRDDLTDALKQGDAAEFGEVRVGARQLKDLVKLLPQDFCFVKSNGSLELETVEERWRKQPGQNTRKCQFIRPPHEYASFKLFKNAWLPKQPAVTVVIRTQKY